MNPEEFSNLVCTTIENVASISKILCDNPDYINLLSMEDYLIVQGIVKEVSWYRQDV